jgi:hypothetical protein
LTICDYSDQFWCVYDISKADVYYKDENEEFIAEDGLESNAGLIKNKCGKDKDGLPACWEDETETRIRVAIRPMGLESPDGKAQIKPSKDFKYLFIQLPEIESVWINPTLEAEEKTKIFDLCKAHGINVNV